ncbi:MAG TPA: S53 family peptidase [Solirubrobacteraceae bacterium]|nr:S53 family peptidase [Solirubrobacteraceae bacterium]
MDLRPRLLRVLTRASMPPLLCLLLGLSGLGASAAHAAPAGHRVGTAAVLPRGAHRLGPLVPTRIIAAEVAMAPRHPGALAALVRAVSTPGNPDFRHYLSLRAFRARFAPTAATLRAVRAGLRAAGLDPAAVSGNGLLMTISAPAGTLERALGTPLDAVRAADGRVAYANLRAPRLHGGWAAAVQGIVGLDSVNRPRALGLSRSGSPAEPSVTPRGAQAEPDRRGGRTGRLRARSLGAPVSPCAAATSTATQDGGYTADAIASSYGLSSLYSGGDAGAGQTVGLMEFEPFSSSDIAAYNACYGIDGGTTNDVSTVAVSAGGLTGAGTGSGQGEAALDIEQVLGLAPAAKVAVYEAPNTYLGDINAYTDMVQNPAISVISTSWGECEAATGTSAAQAEATVFQEAVVQGVSVFAAAGDSGSTDCYGLSGLPSATQGSLAVDDPGSQPDVTSVGGTTLPSADPATQTAWNDSQYGGGAGGGGISLLWTMPSYQSSASAALGVVSATSSSAACAAANPGVSGALCREVPDVSADADPYSGYPIVFQGAWVSMGGTSAAAPLWAALTALADASTSCSGVRVGFVNPLLYALASDPTTYARDFTDITAGNNDMTASGYLGGLYPAHSGYDLATGLGTPQAAGLVPDLCHAAGGTGTTTTTSSTGTSGGGTSAGTGTGTTSPVSFPAPAPPSAPVSTTTGTATTPTSTAPAPAPTAPVVSSPTAPGAGTGTPSCTPIRLALGDLTLALGPHRTRVLRAWRFTLPAGCAHALVRFRLQIRTSEPGSRRRADVVHLLLAEAGMGPARAFASLSARSAGPGWTTVSVRLDAFRGHRLDLLFRAHRGGRARSRFRITGASLSLS